MDKIREIQLIATNLGMINELLETKESRNVAIAQKYLNILFFKIVDAN